MTLPGLDGQVIAVAGGAGGIGSAVLRMLAAEDVQSYCLDAVVPPGPSHERPPGNSFMPCDVKHPESVVEAMKAIVRRHGRLDGLVNVAGIRRDRMLHRMTEAEWQDVLDVNLTGAFLLTREAAQIMRDQGRGSIVHVTSVNGLRGKVGQANYTASKAGLIALTRTAARELGAKGVRVNAVAPGMIRTPMTRNLPAEVLQGALDETALGRIGDPEDVAGAVLFLLSDLARHVTGHVLVVDGGQTA